MLSILLTAGAILLFTFFDAPLIGLFLHDGSASGDLQLTLLSGQEYLKIMLIGLIPFALSQIYSSTLREIGQTKVTMKAGITAVFVNLVFNWLLIYGHFGFPALGIMGAAVATVLSRIVECCIVVLWLHTHSGQHTFIRRVWRSLRLPGYLVLDIIVKGMPLLVNEALWSMSMTVINQCYSTRGLAAVAAVNISSTIVNLFNVVNTSLGGSVGIIVGRLLGQGKFEEAVDTNTKLTTFAVGSCAVVGWILAATSGIFPAFYNTTDEVRELATYFLRVVGFMAPFAAFTHCAYYTLRCGGKTMIVFVFDCVFICVVTLPIAYSIAYFTDMGIRPMYAACQLATVLKFVFGLYLVRKKTWVNNIVGGK
jgi:putative MATE family efflux protein